MVLYFPSCQTTSFFGFTWEVTGRKNKSGRLCFSASLSDKANVKEKRNGRDQPTSAEKITTVLSIALFETDFQPLQTFCKTWDKFSIPCLIIQPRYCIDLKPAISTNNKDYLLN